MTVDQPPAAGTATEQAEARARQARDSLYRIADAAATARDLPSLYASIHEIVRDLIYADNFFIALYDESRQRIRFPFFLDGAETEPPDPNEWKALQDGKGATAYVLRTGKPLFLDPETVDDLAAKGEIDRDVLRGTSAELWLGTPLVADGHTIGVLAVQTYRTDRTYERADLDLLTFVGRHIAMALSREGAIEETRQRNAELAVINEIGTALAEQLDFDAIVDLVGDRIDRSSRSRPGRSRCTTSRRRSSERRTRSTRPEGTIPIPGSSGRASRRRSSRPAGRCASIPPRKPLRSTPS